MLATLRHKNVALLWSAGLISLTGDWLLLIALPIYVYTLTHSTALTSVTFIVEALPSVLLGSVAGVFVDRWDRRRTMVAANLAQATGLLPLLAVRSADQLWLVYTVSVVEAILALFFAPAEQSLLPTLVDDERLVAANALSALNGNLARLAGAPLGGLVAGLLGLGGAVVLDAASFLLSSLLILAITISTTESKVGQPDHAAATTAHIERVAAADSSGGSAANAWTGLWREWTAGLSLVRRGHTVSALFLIMAVQAMAQGLFLVLFIVFVEQVLRNGPAAIGLLRGVQAIGGLLGGLTVAALGRRLPMASLVGLGAILFGLIDLAIWNAPMLTPAYALPLTVALFILVGLPGAGMMSGATTLLQESVADAYRGRVFGAFATTSALAQLIGMAAAGALGDRLGVVPVLNGQAGLYLLAGLLALALLRA